MSADSHLHHDTRAIVDQSCQFFTFGTRDKHGHDFVTYGNLKIENHLEF